MSGVVDTRATRRDFITYAGGAFTGVGGAVALWPFIDQMNPSGATPLPQTRDLDLRSIQPGQTGSVAWQAKPVLVRNRTADGQGLWALTRNRLFRSSYQRRRGPLSMWNSPPP